MPRTKILSSLRNARWVIRHADGTYYQGSGSYDDSWQTGTGPGAYIYCARGDGTAPHSLEDDAAYLRSCGIPCEIVRLP